MIDAWTDTISIQSQLRDIHEAIKAELPAIARVAVAIYDEETDVLKTFVHSTDGEVPFSHYEAKLKLVPSLRALADSRAQRVIEDLQAQTIHPGLPGNHITRLLATGYRSSYTLPFYDHGQFFGFLFFDSGEPGYFVPSVVRHLTVYAHLISLLIVNEVLRVSALRSAIDIARTMSRTHSDETGSHLDRMAHYARLIAKTLADRDPYDAIDDEFVEFVFLYAPLHDVGKIAIPDSILLKPSKLSDSEFAVMKTHVQAGMSIVESIASGFHVGSGQHVAVLRNIVRFHHEAFDGSGYLTGCRGADIPLEARIVTVADVFDALTTDRCYKAAWSNDDAFRLMGELSGSRFDPDCVAALIANRATIEAIQDQFRGQQPVPRRLHDRPVIPARCGGSASTPVPALYSRARSSSLTCAGLALPAVAFITWPTSQPSTFSLPARNCSTWVGLSATTLATAASMAPASVICRNPLASMMADGSPPVSAMISNTSLASRPEMVPSASRSSSLPSASAEIGEVAMLLPCLFSTANRLVITQLAACLPSRPRATDFEVLGSLLLGGQDGWRRRG